MIAMSRRHTFLTRYKKAHSSSGNTVRYVGGSMGALGATMGQNVGNGIGYSISAAKQIPYNVPKRFIIYFSKLMGIISLLGLFGMLLPDFIQVILFIFTAPVVFLLFFLPLVGNFLGRQDFKKYKKLRKLENEGSPQDVDELISHLSDRHPETRYAALYGIQSICEDTPGKLLKHTSHDRESLASTLVGHLSETDEDILQSCSGAIKWLARDYGEMFVSHSKTIAQHIESPHAAVQVNIVIALGNIAQFDHEHSSAYAKALSPAVKDLDSEVRKAAAATLGKLHCSESVKMLEYLVDNETAPDVIQEARNSLEQLRNQTTA